MIVRALGDRAVSDCLATIIETRILETQGLRESHVSKLEHDSSRSVLAVVRHGPGRCEEQEGLVPGPSRPTKRRAPPIRLVKDQ